MSDIYTGYLREKQAKIERRVEELEDPRWDDADTLMILSEIASLAKSIEHEVGVQVRRVQRESALGV